MATLLIGPTGAGKTAALQRRWNELAGVGRVDQVLVLTATSGHAHRWRESIALGSYGTPQVYSYFAFVQRELAAYWSLLQEREPAARRWLEPVFLNVETAHHLMLQEVERRLPAFAGVTASPQRVAIQLVSNLGTVAAAAGLPEGEEGLRLAAAAGGRHGELYAAVSECLAAYRTRCLTAGALDYGLSLSHYHRALLPHPDYQRLLGRRFRHLLVDDLDEAVPLEHLFILDRLPHLESALIAFGEDGGHSAFMGADPELALARLGPHVQVTRLAGSRTCSRELGRLGAALHARVLGGAPAGGSGGVLQVVHTELRGEMLDSAAERVAELLRRGVPPGEVAVITPSLDKAVEVALARALGGRAGVQNISLSRRLLDEPHARAVITLAALAQPGWGVQPGRGALAGAFQVLLGLDPVRAALLAEAAWNGGRPALPDLDAAHLRRRTGFEKGESYDFLCAWLARAREQEWEMDSFVQAAFAELLAPLGRQAGELRPCRQLLLSAHRFRRVLERAEPGGTYGRRYLEMVLAGTVAGEPLEAYLVQPDQVVLATPFSYLMARATSRYQVWLDLANDAWLPSYVKELANPHVLRPDWPTGALWTDELALAARLQAGARTARALLRRCRGKVVLAWSDLNAWGMEQEGGLSAAFADLTAAPAPAGGVGG